MTFTIPVFNSTNLSAHEVIHPPCPAAHGKSQGRLRWGHPSRTEPRSNNPPWLQTAGRLSSQVNPRRFPQLWEWLIFRQTTQIICFRVTGIFWRHYTSIWLGYGSTWGQEVFIWLRGWEQNEIWFSDLLPLIEKGSSSSWTQVWGRMRPGVHFLCEQSRSILRAAKDPPKPPAAPSCPFPGLNLAKQICSDLGSWAQWVGKASGCVRTATRSLREERNSGDVICTGVISLHTSTSSLSHCAGFAHRASKKHPPVLSANTDKTALRSSVLYWEGENALWVAAADTNCTAQEKSY